MSEPRLSHALAKSQGHSLYRRKDCQIGIVHLGIGAFHRAHQAVYTHQYMAQSGDTHWFIAGVSLRSAGVRDQLAPQDGLYTVKASSVQGEQTELVQSVATVLVAPEDPQAVLCLMAAKNTKIISLTVTEKGYCHDPATGNLNASHPGVQADLKNLSAPTTAIGYLVASLKTRFDNDLPVPTILCCDNLPDNGHTLRSIILQFAALVDTSLADWIKNLVPFPNTMVDRIVPATTEQDIAKLAEQQGYVDLGMVKTEAFSQWIIEDNFAQGRPQWENVGAMLVKDVTPFEHAKLRLLNGAHSALAYAGYLNGFQHVHQVMQDNDFVTFLRQMMEKEIAPTLTAPPGMSIDSYINELLQRFSNPALHHKTYQIAMDGSQKLPQRLLHTIEERLMNQCEVECLSFAVACWLRYTMAFDLKGDPIEVQDPLADELVAIQQAHFYQIDDLIQGYLAFDKVFSQRLHDSTHFRERLGYWLSYILANGIAPALKSLLLEVKDYKPHSAGGIA